jgi:signal peptide peptidase SppA
MLRHPITGCDAAQLFGAWAILPTELEAMLAYAQSHPPQAPDEEAEARAREAESSGRKPYVIEDGIARLHLAGPMTKKRTSYQSMFGGTSTIALRNAIREALHDDEVKGAFLEIDSPGGTVAGTNALADDIASLAASKPLHAHVHDTMASAALWAGSQSGYVTADPAASIGSIGVIARLVDTSGRYEAEKVKIHVITTGPYKGVGASGAPVPKEHIQEVQREIDAIHELFVAAISRGTGLSPAAVRLMADGRVHLASDARRMGLIDRVASLDDAFNQLKESISANRLGRGRAGRSSIVATTHQRNDSMESLTPAQLALVQSIPGCTHATADTGFAALISAATANAKTAGEAATANTNLAEENKRLQKENDELKAKAQPATPRELAMAQREARSLLAPLSGTKISPACADAFAESFIGKDGEPVVSALTPDAQGQSMASKFLAVLAKNDGVLATGAQKTEAQPVGRTAPGGGGEKDMATIIAEARAEGAAFEKQQLQARGLNAG